MCHEMLAWRPALFTARNAHPMVDNLLLMRLHVSIRWQPWLMTFHLALQVRLGPSGVEEVRGLGELNAVEQKGVDDLIPILEGNINKGIEFAKTPGNEK